MSQKLNKSHPHIFPILNSILNNDINDFKTNFNNNGYSCFIIIFKNH